MRRAIALLLDDPRLAAAIEAQPAHWRELDNAGSKLLGELLAIIADEPEITSVSLCERWRETDHAAVIAQLSNSALVAHMPSEGRDQELQAAIQRLNRDGLAARRQRLLAKASTDGLTPEERAQLREPLTPGR